MRQGDKGTWKRFGTLVRRLRKEKRLGLREMSKMATAQMGGRGLSAPYLSAIERGLTAPPRLPILQLLANIFDVPANKLRLAAEGYVVLDIAETLEAFPKYAALVRDLRQGGKGDSDAIRRAMFDALKQYPTGADHKMIISISNGGTQYLFYYRPTRL